MIACSFCAVFVGGSVSAYDNSRHPVRVICARYREMPREVFMTPYEVCLYALDDLDNKGHQQDVRNFLEWYLKRINYSDKNGMSGTIYDIVLHGNKEQILPQYDSIDGYSGIFLVLMDKYYRQTGDASLINRYWESLESIAYTIAYLQQADGLTIAMPDYPVKYLMDNCEAYGGIISFLNLAQQTGHKINAKYYRNVAGGIKNGVFSILGTAEDDSLAWSGEDDGKISDGSVFYPDAYAQLFLIYYDLLDADRQQFFWKKFVIEHPAVEWKTQPPEQATFCGLVSKKMESAR